VSDDDDLYLPPPRSPIPVAVLVSALTTAALFFGLRALDHRGALPGAIASWTGGAGPFAAGIDPGAVAEVPSVLGLPVAEARAALNARGLLLVLGGERFNGKRAAGTVGEQAPLAGSQLHRGDAVQIFLSLGARSVRVPKVTGLKVEDAARALASAELVAGPTTAVASDGVPPGLVVGTTPAEGSTLAAQSTVALTVAAGVPPKPTPKVAGLRLRAARDAIAQAGFKVGKIQYLVDGDRPSGIVLDQSPAAETPLAPGATIDLTVNDE
jgi:serine/threonine-protein kinase